MKETTIDLQDKQQAQEHIAEINKHIREGIKAYADVCLLADADEWAYDLNYFPSDIFNATLIFQHICSNVGIKKGLIDEERAEFLGSKLRKLVFDMTGFDPAAIAANENKGAK
jgi:TPP-dependent 2-oxoacid decarboxylase